MILMQRDGKRAIDVSMKEWSEATNSWSCELAYDFFDAGTLEREEVSGLGMVYYVDDVGYCIAQTEDWEAHTGDYADDDDYDGEEDPERWAFCDEISCGMDI